MILLLLACGTPDTTIVTRGDDTGAADGEPAALFDPAELIWTDMAVGYSAVQQLTIESVGVGEITVYQVDLLSDTSGSFAFDRVQNVVIAAGARQSWPVTCELAVAEVASASLRVRTDDPANGEIQLPLTCSPAP